METQLATLQAEIENVEKQIQDAGTSYLHALNDGNQNLMQYWGKEKEQLRKKEQQLRKKKLLLLQVSHGVGVSGNKRARNDEAEAHTFSETVESSVRIDWESEAKLVGASVGDSLEKAHLANPEMVTTVQLPVLRSDLVPSEIRFMGREEFPKVLKFVEEALVGRSVYTGLPGAGKSFIFGAVAAYLHGKFKRETGGRVIYMQGGSFAAGHLTATLRALMVAFHDDPEAMSELKLLRGDRAVIGWLSRRKKKNRLYVLVDDGNYFDIGEKARSLLPRKEREAASIFLTLLTENLVYVTCASIGSDVYKLLFTDKPVPYYMADPAFSVSNAVSLIRFTVSFVQEKELEKYLKLIEKPASWSEDLEFLQKTGRVPRLVSQYGTPAFEETGDTIRDFIVGHIKEEQRLGRLEEFIDVVAGARCRSVPRALLSRCFYSQEGRGACMTEAFLRYTQVQIAKNYEQLQREGTELAIRRWTATMRSENVKSRIGLNAEAATMLALRSSRLKIEEDFVIRFEPETVVEFSGTFPGFEGAGRVLSLPSNPSQKGLYCYYADLGFVIGIQITTAFDPENTHKGTYESFLAAARNEARKKVMLWVVYGKDSFMRRHETDDVTEIFCCFGDLHGCLSLVDDACLRIDEHKIENKASKMISKAGDRCNAIVKSSGLRCRRYCVKGTTYCLSHNK